MNKKSNVKESEDIDKQLMLEVLRNEYDSLYDRLQQVRKLIINLGGEIPLALYEFMPTQQEFPYSKTIKDKIIFILEKQKGRELTAKQILNILRSFDPEAVFSSVAQFCSMMGKTGEIEVIEGYRNKYFIRPKKKVQEEHRTNKNKAPKS